MPAIECVRNIPRIVQLNTDKEENMLGIDVTSIPILIQNEEVDRRYR
jgi:hypothetical protein